MEKRFVLFLMLSSLILFGHLMLRPQPPAPGEQAQGGPDQPPAAKPVEKPPAGKPAGQPDQPAPDQPGKPDGTAAAAKPGTKSPAAEEPPEPSCRPNASRSGRWPRTAPTACWSP